MKQAQIKAKVQVKSEDDKAKKEQDRMLKQMQEENERL